MPSSLVLSPNASRKCLAALDRSMRCERETKERGWDSLELEEEDIDVGGGITITGFSAFKCV